MLRSTPCTGRRRRSSTPSRPGATRCAWTTPALSEALTALKQARATAEAHHFDREASRGNASSCGGCGTSCCLAGGTDSDLAAALYNGFDSALLSSAWRFLGAPVPKIGNLQPSRDARAADDAAAPPGLLAEAVSSHVSTSSGPSHGAAQNRLPVHALAVVEAEFNACLDELLRVCSPAVAARLPLLAELRGGVSAGRVRARPPGFIRGAAVGRARAAPSGTRATGSRKKGGQSNGRSRCNRLCIATGDGRSLSK